MKTHLTILLAATLAGPPVLWSQANGNFIEHEYLEKNDPGLIAGAQSLKKTGALVLNMKKAAAALSKPSPAVVKLPPASTLRLEPEAIAARARSALIRVGWLCLCAHCDRWHVSLSGGYAVAPDGVVVTCHHVVSPEGKSMREGYLVATDTKGRVFPVTSILAADKELDAAVIRVAAEDLNVLPINDQCPPGAAAYVLSDPLGLAGYFSAGIVNRYYWEAGHEEKAATTLKAVRHLRMNVSTDWGPGSSGAAVLDACGNVIGHVSVINAMSFDDDGGKSPKSSASGPDADEGTILVLHQAIPARGVKLILEAMARH